MGARVLYRFGYPHDHVAIWVYLDTMAGFDHDGAHGDGWLVKIRLSDKNELKNLLTAEDYQKYIAAESES